MIIATQCLALLAAPALGCSSPLLAVLDHQVPTAEAQRRGGGGGARAGGGGAHAGGAARAGGAGASRQAARSPGNVRATSNGSINRSANSNRNVNRNTNVNRNVNVNNVNVHGGGGGCYGCGWDNGGFGAGMVVGTMTGAMVGAAAASNNNSTTVIYQTGSVVTSLPGGCTTVVANGISYQQCGSTWYEPRYSGQNVEYVVVNQP